MDELSGNTQGNEGQSTEPTEAPPPTPVAPASILNDTEIDPLRDFLRTSGGSLLFALSAVSIFWGLSAVVGPVLSTSFSLADTLPAIGAIGFYELSLFAVLFALVLGWSITRDSILLLVLVAVFLITLSLLVSTVANDEPLAVLGVAAVIFVMALAQLVAVRRRIGVPFGRLSMAGIGCLFAWNGFNATLLAYYIGDGASDVRVAVDLWQYTCWVPIAGAMLFYTSAWRTRERACANAHANRPFLRTPGMAWVFIATLLAGTLVHQYAMAYIFDLPQYVVDYLPLIALASLTLIEIARGYGRMTREVVVAAGVVPLCAMVIALTNASYDVGSGLGQGIGVPFIATATFTAAMFAIMTLRYVRRDFLVLGGIYLFIAILTGFPQSNDAGVETIDWGFARIALLALALPLLVVIHNPTLWAFALAFAAVAAPAFAPFRDLIDYENLDYASRSAARGMTFGIGVMALTLIYGTGVYRAIVWLGAVILTACTLHFMLANETLSPQAAFAIATAVCAGLVFWRTRDGVAATLLAVPSLRLSYDALHDAGGWRYILLGFVLLVMGAIWSVRSSRLAPVRETHD